LSITDEGEESVTYYYSSQSSVLFEVISEWKETRLRCKAEAIRASELAKIETDPEKKRQLDE
jgi:hypothetical protein